ncbi:RDD family protein [Curtobacterium sp. PhB137]|uniref:VanZ family protein n=1 Tax=Curtobacterium sp. PhB137 TaxID=2485182 RepID=UPI000F4E8CA6|nr:VanZ family protein [Curtobacterium sp. PhB137]RPE76793.1 RDD family protein [Curtobacterium sp. PhB137]
MTSATPAVIALLVGSAIAIAGLVPWAALQYRRRGTLGVGNAVLAFATVVYGLALVTYTLLPLPDTSEVAAICRAASGPQLTPFAFVGDIAKEGGLSGPRSLLANPAAAQVVFNVILFVPLGMLVRHVFLHGRFLAGVVVGTVAGLLVSLLIECTQLTGDWFLYPCSYRLFDVDDLLANTTGALVGTLVSPVLWVLVRHRGEPSSDLPRRVTIWRRGFGMFCDLLAMVLTSGALVSITSLSFALAGQDLNSTLAKVLLATFPFVAPAIQLIVVLASGRTLGEAVVRLRPEPRPTAWQRLVRWAAGSGGWATASAAALPFTGLLAFALAVAAVIGLFATRGRRGFANVLARVDVVDERAAREGSTERS